MALYIAEFAQCQTCGFVVLRERGAKGPCSCLPAIESADLSEVLDQFTHVYKGSDPHARPQKPQKPPK